MLFFMAFRLWMMVGGGVMDGCMSYGVWGMGDTFCSSYPTYLFSSSPLLSSHLSPLLLSPLLSSPSSHPSLVHLLSMSQTETLNVKTDGVVADPHVLVLVSSDDELRVRGECLKERINKRRGGKGRGGEGREGEVRGGEGRGGERGEGGEREGREGRGRGEGGEREGRGREKGKKRGGGTE